jgi:hypothetical protein
VHAASPTLPLRRGARQGKRIFRDALDDGSVDSFFPLVQHFQTQSEPASCALGTLCMVRQSAPGIWRESAHAGARARRC